MSKLLSRAETKKAISELPVERVLQIKNSTLTSRQKQFAKAVAEGSTGADAYRLAYSKNGKKKTHGDNASRLKADERIKAEIEAHAMALELQKYRTSEGLRALALSSLVEVLLDAESKPAHKLQAARIIGQVTEVALFTTRSEVKHVSDSGEIKEKILAQIKSLMMTAGSTGDITDVAASDLLAELNADDDAMISAQDDERESGADDGVDFLADDEPHRTPTPPELNEPRPDHIHTIPHEPTEIILESTPIAFVNEEGGGVYKNESVDVIKVASADIRR